MCFKTISYELCQQNTNTLYQLTLEISAVPALMQMFLSHCSAKMVAQLK